jgi:hypothetical protein
MLVMCLSLTQHPPDLIRLQSALLKGRLEAVLKLEWVEGGGHGRGVAAAGKGVQTGGLFAAGVGFCRLKGGVLG